MCHRLIGSFFSFSKRCVLCSVKFAIGKNGVEDHEVVLIGYYCSDWVRCLMKCAAEVWSENRANCIWFSMCEIRVCNALMSGLYIACIVISCSGLSHGSLVDKKVLNVGEELWRETLPLKMGSRLYRLQGIKPETWYEVKISYPASIPASFSIQLKRGDLEIPLNANRRLLNTEKLIFKSEKDGSNDQDGMYVLVTVEPEGVVAVPNVQERKYIIFNIVCDELLLGIPHQAWWVVGFVVLCLVLAFIIPSFLPPFLLRSLDQNASKAS